MNSAGDGFLAVVTVMAKIPAGLCEDCAYAKSVASARGSTFWMCRRHEDDPAHFAKYPRLPVARCAGYEKRAPADPPAR